MELYHHNKSMYLRLVGGFVMTCADDCMELTSKVFNMIAKLFKTNYNRYVTINVEKLLTQPNEVAKFSIIWNKVTHIITLEKEIQNKYANIFANTFYYAIKFDKLITTINLFMRKNRNNDTYNIVHAYCEGCQLGRGSFGTVYQGFFTTNSSSEHKLTAIKVMDFRKSEINIIAEYGILSKFTPDQCQKYICLVDEFCYFPKNNSIELFSIMEHNHKEPPSREPLAEYSTINAVFVYEYARNPIKDDIELTTMAKLYKFPRICAQLMKLCINYVIELHNMNIVHKDIKPENIIVYVDSTTEQLIYPKIIDFGSSCQKCNILMPLKTASQYNASYEHPPRCSPTDIAGTINYLFPLINASLFNLDDLWMLWIITDLWALFIMTITIVCNYTHMLLFAAGHTIDSSIPSHIENNEFASLYNLNKVVKILTNPDETYQKNFILAFLGELSLHFKKSIWESAKKMEITKHQDTFLYITESILNNFVQYCHTPTYTNGNTLQANIKMLLITLIDHIINTVSDTIPLPTPDPPLRLPTLVPIDQYPQGVSANQLL